MSATPSAVSLFAIAATAQALAVVSPGPDFAMVLRQTLAHGRAAGTRTALGIACGLSVHVTYAFFGLGWVIDAWPPLLNLLRVAGAGVLLWFGWGALRAPPPTQAPLNPAPDARPAAADFGIGFLTNVLNVKAVLFFVGLATVVIGDATPVWLRLTLGLWMVAVTAAWFSALAWTLCHSRVRETLLRHRQRIDRAMGVLLITLGVILLGQCVAVLIAR